MGKAERTRQMIIETAATIFNKKGVAGTSIDDVLHATKVAKGCLYGHFESKDALAHATVDHLMEKIAKKAGSLIEGQETAKLKLFAFMELYKNPLEPFIDGGCPILNFGVESDDTDSVIKRKVRSVVGMTTSVLSDIIKEGIIKGELSPEIDAEKYPVKILATLEGGMLISRVIESNSGMDVVMAMLKTEIEHYEKN